ncbi:hypothetical protein [Neptuniibacter sp. QD37_11]|uniref:hypothetical protein n=1 Tax=Neptuniibacter sp. QD37_11 TaxID=3398209 RepID=UPI0039F5FDF9
MSKPKIILVDQREINASYDEVTLFLNYRFIAVTDHELDISIKEVSENIAKALGSDVETVVIGPAMLAKVRASNMGKDEYLACLHDIVEGENLDQWCQGYTNTDLLRCLQQMKHDVPSDLLV